MAGKSKDKDDEARVFTPFGVMVGDAGAMKSFDDESFYDEVLEPSEKAMYKKFKVNFIINPDVKSSYTVTSGIRFIPWKQPVCQSKGRNSIILKRIASNTWALNKEAVPGFVDLIEKLRQKYSTVLGDDKLLEHLEAAQHRARELEVSTEAPSGTPTSSSHKSRMDLENFYNSNINSSGSRGDGLGDFGRGEDFDMAMDYILRKRIPRNFDSIYYAISDSTGWDDDVRLSSMTKAICEELGVVSTGLSSKPVSSVKSKADLDNFYARSIKSSGSTSKIYEYKVLLSSDADLTDDLMGTLNKAFGFAWVQLMEVRNSLNDF